jgi:hypothetical protein
MPADAAARIGGQCPRFVWHAGTLREAVPYVSRNLN